MANNRLSLKFNPTGKHLVIAKRFGDKYQSVENVEEKLDKFLDECWHEHIDIPDAHVDDFSLEIEIPPSENTPQGI